MIITIIKKYSRALIALVCILACLIGIVCCLWREPVSEPERVFNRFVDAYNDRDFKGVIECLDPEKQLMLKGAQAFANMFSDAMGVGGLGEFVSDESLGLAFMMTEGDKVDVKVVSVTYNKDETAATIVGKVKDGKRTEYGTIEMIKVANKWYLDI